MVPAVGQHIDHHSNQLPNTGQADTTISIREPSERFPAEADEVREGGLFSVDFCAEWFRTE